MNTKQLTQEVAEIKSVLTQTSTALAGLTQFLNAQERAKVTQAVLPVKKEAPPAWKVSKSDVRSYLAERGPAFEKIPYRTSARVCRDQKSEACKAAAGAFRLTTIAGQKTLDKADSKKPALKNWYWNTCPECKAHAAKGEVISSEEWA
jgi:prophage DNA circulation protein